MQLSVARGGVEMCRGTRNVLAVLGCIGGTGRGEILQAQQFIEAGLCKSQQNSPGGCAQWPAVVVVLDARRAAREIDAQLAGFDGRAIGARQ